MKNKKNMEVEFKNNKEGELMCMIKGKWVKESVGVSWDKDGVYIGGEEEDYD